MQCLLKCREDISKELKMKKDDIELSMGMSGDFEMAVRLRSWYYSKDSSFWSINVRRWMHNFSDLSTAKLSLRTCQQLQSLKLPAIDYHYKMHMQFLLSFQWKQAGLFRKSLCCTLQIDGGSTNVRLGSTIFGQRDYKYSKPQPE